MASITAKNTSHDERASRLAGLHGRFVEQVTHTQNVQANYFNKGKKPQLFKAGDKVLLRSRTLSTQRPSWKLGARIWRDGDGIEEDMANSALSEIWQYVLAPQNRNDSIFSFSKQTGKARKKIPTEAEPHIESGP